jgi:hypothetical protein
VLAGRGERTSSGFPEVLLVDCENVVLQRNNLRGGKLTKGARRGYKNTNDFLIIAELEIVLHNHVLVPRRLD